MGTPQSFQVSGRKVAIQTPEQFPGLNLSDFHLLRALGEGGMGTVFLAYDPLQSRQVALKLLADHLAKERIHVERFYREARVGATFEHPNIVRTFAFGRDRASGRHFMVLEYVDGPNCRYLLERDGRLNVDDAVLIVYQIAKALAELHAQAIVHRDVKPDNILLSAAGEAKLADFGLAKRIGGPDDLTAQPGGFGSSWYMSYEQAKNASFVDQRSDIFSLGATLYHLLTGAVPFPGDSHAEVVALKQADRFVPAGQLNTSVSPTLDRILGRMLALDPRQRYGSANELVVELERSRLLNAYSVSVAITESDKEAAPDLVTVAATSPDIKDGVPNIDAAWHLRYQDSDGRTFTRRATTRQVIEGLRTHRWPPETEAARAGRQQYRRLTEYPDFMQSELNQQVSNRRAFRKLVMIAGFGVGLLAAAVLASVLRGLFCDEATDNPVTSAVCFMIAAVRSVW